MKGGGRGREEEQRERVEGEGGMDVGWREGGGCTIGHLVCICTDLTYIT